MNKRKEEELQFEAALHRDFEEVFDYTGRGVPRLGLGFLLAMLRYSESVSTSILLDQVI